MVAALENDGLIREARRSSECRTPRRSHTAQLLNRVMIADRADPGTHHMKKVPRSLELPASSTPTTVPPVPENLKAFGDGRIPRSSRLTDHGGGGVPGLARTAFARREFRSAQDEPGHAHRENDDIGRCGLRNPELFAIRFSATMKTFLDRLGFCVPPPRASSQDLHQHRGPGHLTADRRL